MLVGFVSKMTGKIVSRYGGNIAKNVEGYCANQWNDITVVSVCRKEEIFSVVSKPH